MIKDITIDKLDKEEYKYFFYNAINSTPFHSLEFLEAIAKSRDDLILKFSILKSGNKTIAIMPFFTKKKLPFIMISSLYGCYGGYMFFDKQIFTNISKHYKLISSIVDYNDTLLYAKNFNFELFSTWIIDTKKSYEYIFTRLHSKTRNQIRKAYKENINVHDIEDKDELNNVLDIYNQLVQKHNILIPYSKNLFEQLYKFSLISNNIIFKVAKLDDKIISYSVFLQNSKSIFYWLNASDSQYLKYNGTNIILDNMLKYAVKNNFSEINMGAVPVDNNGLLHFKSRWNANEKKYKVYYSKLYYLLKRFRWRIK